MHWDLDGGRDHGAGKLLRYINRSQERGEERERGLRNRYGEPMSDEERTEFIERSRDYSHEKQLVLSPANGHELSDEELSRMARRNVSDLVADRPSADYCYAIHRDTEHPHVQVALTGTRSDLYVSPDERDRHRERAREQFREREYQHRRAREQKRERERERTRERSRVQEEEHEWSCSYGRGF
jgi:hypothetical protein